MYGVCQAKGHCSEKATHQVQFRGQPKDLMYVCSEHAEAYRKPGNVVDTIE